MAWLIVLSPRISPVLDALVVDLGGEVATESASQGQFVPDTVGPAGGLELAPRLRQAALDVGSAARVDGSLFGVCRVIVRIFGLGEGCARDDEREQRGGQCDGSAQMHFRCLLSQRGWLREVNSLSCR